MNESDEKQYTLQELSYFKHLATHNTILYLQGPFIPTNKSRKDAAYSHLHIKLLKEIRVRKDQGYTLNEIKGILSKDNVEQKALEPISWQSYEVSDRVHVIVRSDTSRWVLENILKNIEKMKQELQF